MMMIYVFVWNVSIGMIVIRSGRLSSIWVLCWLYVYFVVSVVNVSMFIVVV